MGSPLGALFANIFMCELENTIIPSLGDKVRHWKRYVDGTFAFIKPNMEQEIQLALNSFHEKSYSFIETLEIEIERCYQKDSIINYHLEIQQNWTASLGKRLKINTEIKDDKLYLSMLSLIHI